MAACFASATAFCQNRAILDCVVASVGNVAITSTDVEREYRLERFLDGQWPAPAPDAAALERVRERLIDRVLLSQEDTSATGVDAGAEKAAETRLATLHKGFARSEDFGAALQSLGLTEVELTARLVGEDHMLHVIDQRLRPEASPSDEAVMNYYRQTLVPEFQKKNPAAAAPAFPDVEDQIREVLTQKRINELLDQWIEELKPASHVRIHSF